MTETITGATGGNTATGSKVFKTVTSITPGSTVGTGAVTIGHAAATFLSQYSQNFFYSVNFFRSNNKFNCKFY